MQSSTGDPWEDEGFGGEDDWDGRESLAADLEDEDESEEGPVPGEIEDDTDVADGLSMVDATISRVRMRDLARRGRFRARRSRFAAPSSACASRRKSGPKASSLATALPSRSRAASSRPGGGDLVASTI
jgi:hypothetical protein